MTTPQFEFRYYELWMRDQVIEMFCKESDISKRLFSNYFDKFYNHLLFSFFIYYHH